jgi:hypothetical protein
MLLEETAVSIFRALYPERQGIWWRCGNRRGKIEN